MNTQPRSKVKASHLSRDAYLYVRQSTLRQVVENQESTRRQYALRERAVAMGWQPEQVVVVDSDLGRSGATAADREGFQKLVGQVGMGHAGVVIGLEVSRLARNSCDWHRLLEICALTDTLILDEDGLYDPSQYNDRLLLGLKGTMSEAELHTLRARLQGGLLAKARRGELRIGLPVGLVYDDEGRVVHHPDAQVRRAVRLFFETFRRTGTACGTVKYFNRQGLLFPKPVGGGSRTAEVVWGRLSLSRAVSVLHNPRFAGAYAYGRLHARKLPDGRTKVERLPREQWQVLLLDAHPGYISWQEYEQIQQRLSETARAFGLDRRRNAPREGPALLQGLALCGICGSRMIVQYHSRNGRLLPDYLCLIRTMQHRDPPCQSISGATIDEAVGKLLLDTMTPMALELTLAVQAEVQARLEDADRLREQQVERFRYEAELARRRYMQVDPDNRLVASSLEAEWNDRLRAWEEAREQAEQKRVDDRANLDEVMRRRILQLAEDLPAVWNHPSTPNRERKRIAALLLEDVTLVKGEQIDVHVRFRGGATTSLTLPRPLTAQERLATKPEVLAEIDTLLEKHTDTEVVAILNERGHRTGVGKVFTKEALSWVRQYYRLASMKQRLRSSGGLTRKEMSAELGISHCKVKDWWSRGLLRGRIVNDHGDLIFRPVSEQSERIRQLVAERNKQVRKMSANTFIARGAV